MCENAACGSEACFVFAFLISWHLLLRILMPIISLKALVTKNYGYLCCLFFLISSSAIQDRHLEIGLQNQTTTTIVDSQHGSLKELFIRTDPLTHKNDTSFP